MSTCGTVNYLVLQHQIVLFFVFSSHQASNISWFPFSNQNQERQISVPWGALWKVGMLDMYPTPLLHSHRRRLKLYAFYWSWWTLPATQSHPLNYALFLASWRHPNYVPSALLVKQDKNQSLRQSSKKLEQWTHTLLFLLREKLWGGAFLSVLSCVRLGNKLMQKMWNCSSTRFSTTVLGFMLTWATETS